MATIAGGGAGDPNDSRSVNYTIFYGSRTGAGLAGLAGIAGIAGIAVSIAVVSPAAAIGKPAAGSASDRRLSRSAAALARSFPN